MRKRFMRVAGLLILAALLALAAAGCRYSSSYRATMLVRTNGPDTASMSFSTFDGRMVFKLNGPGQIRYAAQLEKGRATVYADDGGGKTECFSIGAGETAGSAAGTWDGGTVYVVVETDGVCEEGSFTFEMEPLE
jgi:hypothetical protein